MPKGKNSMREMIKKRFVRNSCSYEVNSKRGIFLHLKYSHSIIEPKNSRETEEDVRCTLCNKIYLKTETKNHVKKCICRLF